MQYIQSYKFELDPNNVTKTSLRKHVGARRFVWNWALAKRIKLFDENIGRDRFSNYIRDSKEIISLKKNDLTWLYEVSSTIPTQTLLDLDKAFIRFWKYRKEGIGFPKFKKRGQKDGFRIVNSNNGIRIQARYIRLPIIGIIRIKEKNIDKRIEGRILSITISEHCGRWFAAISTTKEVEEIRKKEILPETSIGIDLGIKSFLILSNGTKIEPVNALKRFEKKLKRAQRRLAKKKKGSKNREKAKKRVQKICFDTANLRSNFIHQITSMLSKTKSAIVIEDLSVKSMKFQKHARDAAFRKFRTILTYKCLLAGTNLYVANKWFASSKLCSNCGHKYEKLKLNERKWTCKKCGVFHDRDVNAAKNLLNNLKNSVPVNDRDQGKTIFKKGRSKKSAEKPLAGVQLNELSNVINEAESEFLHQNDVI